MSIEALERRWRAKRPPADSAPEPAPAPGSLDQLIDQMVEARVKAILSEEQDRPQRRSRHLPDFDTKPEFTDFKQLPESPASAPITPGDFSAVLEKNEVGRTIAITATSHGKRQRFVVQRDGRGRAIGMRLEADAHEPLPLPEHTK